MSDTLPNDDDYQGTADNYQAATLYNALDYMIRNVVAGKAFNALVQVKSVTGGGVSTPPRVSVQPMVGQIDGKGNIIPHGEVFDLPVYRLQAGNCAIFIDPIAGDIGGAIICDRDTSNVKANAAPAGPGSFRQNDYADGCYFGGFLNAAPENYIWMKQNGDVAIVSTGTLTHNGINIGFDHKHIDTEPGAGISGPPQP